MTDSNLSKEGVVPLEISKMLPFSLFPVLHAACILLAAMWHRKADIFFGSYAKRTVLRLSESRFVPYLCNVYMGGGTTSKPGALKHTVNWKFCRLLLLDEFCDNVTRIV